MDPAAELVQAQAHIYTHIFSFINSMALKSAVELGIPDAIHTHGGKTITLPDLAAALKIHPTKTPHLHRLMRLLVHSGIFAAAVAENSEEAYALTPSSKLLVIKDNPNCLSSFVTLVPRPEYVTPCHVMGAWLQDNNDDDEKPNNSAFERAYGMPFWEYTERNAEFGARFNEAMACDSGMMIGLELGNCGAVFQGVDSLVDVGGGTGTFAKMILKMFPGMKCKVLELPQVIGDDDLTGSPGNLEFVSGDMFQHVPSADAVLLRMILHDWKDEECVKILKKCKEAILGKGEKGKVIIIDIVMNEKKDEHELTGIKLMFDMLMMLMLNGKERSEKEWERLFLEGGFKHYKITPMSGFKSLIEVFP